MNEKDMKPNQIDSNNQFNERNYKYGLCNEVSYCLDANYYKGTTFEQFLKKHRRQLVIERITE